MTAAWLVAAALLAVAPQTARPPARGDMKTLESTQTSGIERERQVAVRTQEAWLALWNEHAGAARPAPRVDFASHVVVAVFLGSRPTGGYSVEILGTRLEGSTLVVEWREVMPNPRDLTAQVLTAPAHLVQIPARPVEITFEKRQDRS